MTLDQRHKSADKITPPYPLPHVSRRALARVKNPLPPPDTCPYCDSNVDLITHKEKYGRNYGNWPFLYACRYCDAYVGLHPDTDIPLGTLADHQLREARKAAKARFHDLMRMNGFTRNEAYRWLKDAMGIDKKYCHFGWFNIDRCMQAERLCVDAISDAQASQDTLSGQLARLIKEGRL